MMSVLVVDLSDDRLTDIERQVLSIISARLGNAVIKVPPLEYSSLIERCRRALIRSR